MRRRETPTRLIVVALVIGGLFCVRYLQFRSDVKAEVAGEEAPPVPSMKAPADTANEPPPVQLERAIEKPPIDSPGRVALGHYESDVPEITPNLRLLRWPDREPLAGVRVKLYDHWREEFTEVTTSPLGGILLDASEPIAEHLLSIDAEGFESARRIAFSVGSEPHTEVVILRPTRGLYGQVVDWDGAPVEGARIAGFWVEEPRPITASKVTKALHSASAKPEPEPVPPANTKAALPPGASAEPDEALLEELGYGAANQERQPPKAPEPPKPEVHFFSGKGRVSARVATNSEGWYYIPPLPGPVIGRLTLIASSAKGSSEVLRAALPHATLELPEIMIRRPRMLRGTVVDSLDQPLAGATILVQLAEGWSPLWPSITTDAKGKFQFAAPQADLALAVEKAGYVLQGSNLSKPESADGMWDDLVAITPNGSNPKQLFWEVYGSWDTLLPRARHCVQVETSEVEVQLTLTSLGGLELSVGVWGKHETWIQGARVLALRGGYDSGQELTFTDVDGRARVSLVDREWQPELVQISAPGFLPKLIPLALGRLSSPLHVALVPLDEAPIRERDLCTGRVLAGDGTPRAAQVAVYSLKGGNGWILWSGTCGEDGRFEFDRPQDSTPLLACALWEADGARAGVKLPPLAARSWPSDRPLVLQLAPPSELTLITFGLESGVPYRIRWEVTPKRGLPALEQGILPLTVGTADSQVQPLSIPTGWIVQALVESVTMENVAAADFDRGERREYVFPSSRLTWKSWAPVSRQATQPVSDWVSRMHLVVGRQVSIVGMVTGMPWLADPGSVHVAALGELGTWIARVDGNGWFDVRGVPPGTYHLVLYRRRAEAAFELGDQGDEIGGVVAECTYRFNDVVIPWGKGNGK